MLYFELASSLVVGAMVSLRTSETAPLAEVAELADALASGASGRKPMKVRVLSSAPFDSPWRPAFGEPPGSLMASHVTSNALSEPHSGESKGSTRFASAPLKISLKPESGTGLRLTVAGRQRRWHRRLMAWVYILLCRDNSLYVGATADLSSRIADHQAGKGGAYTSRRCPVVLVHSEEFGDLPAAIARERQIKKWTAHKKRALIRGDFRLCTDSRGDRRAPS